MANKKHDQPIVIELTGEFQVCVEYLAAEFGKTISAYISDALMHVVKRDAKTLSLIQKQQVKAPIGVAKTATKQ